MFTGIVEDIGEITATETRSGDLRLSVRPNRIDVSRVGMGDSVSVNGACLTVVGMTDGTLDFDVSRESLAHTNIGGWQVGTRVNLEQALLPTTRLGGHLVSGHVDGQARVSRVEADARSTRLEFECPAELQRYIARKGSVTLDGVSLTVNGVGAPGFDVNIVPHTSEVTTLGNLAAGDSVHIEVDQVARYLESLLEGRAGDAGDDSALRDTLERSGFLG